MTVATALAVSWKPLANSKMQTANTQIMNKTAIPESNPNMMLQNWVGYVTKLLSL